MCAGQTATLSSPITKAVSLHLELRIQLGWPACEFRTHLRMLATAGLGLLIKAILYQLL